MNTNQISPLSQKINSRISELVQKGELNNLDLISITNNICDFFNLKTYSDYARDEKISYNGVKTRLEAGKIESIELFGVKFIIDNE